MPVGAYLLAGDELRSPFRHVLDLMHLFLTPTAPSTVYIVSTPRAKQLLGSGVIAPRRTALVSPHTSQTREGLTTGTLVQFFSGPRN